MDIWRRMHNSWHYASYRQKINTSLCLENMLHFISLPLYTLHLYYKCKIVFSMSDRICAFLKTETYTLCCNWAKFLNQGGFVFNLLCCWSHGNRPGAMWYMPCAWNCDYTPNVSDGRSIKAGAGRRILESRQCPNGDTQFNLNAYYLFWVSHTSCLVKQGDHFFSPRGLKSRYSYCITDGEYKVDSSSTEPSMENSFGFQGSDNGDYSCAHEFKEFCVCILKKYNGS